MRRDSHEVAVGVEAQCYKAYGELRKAQDAINAIIALGWGEKLGHLALTQEHLERAFYELNNARTWINKEYQALPDDVKRLITARPEVTNAEVAEIEKSSAIC